MTPRRSPPGARTPARASPRTPPRVSRARTGSPEPPPTEVRRPAKDGRLRPGRPEEFRANHQRGIKASAMGDEDPVMPVGDNVTFENTYMQKPEEFGEVRPSYSTRARRTRFFLDRLEPALSGCHPPSSHFWNERTTSARARFSRIRRLTRPSPTRSSRLSTPRRGTSSCAARFRKS